MTLDEIEKLAIDWRKATPSDRPGSYVADDLAAIVRVLLPVVRQAELIRRGHYASRSRLTVDDRRAFDDFNQAVDEMRMALEQL